MLIDLICLKIVWRSLLLQYQRSKLILICNHYIQGWQMKIILKYWVLSAFRALLIHVDNTIVINSLDLFTFTKSIWATQNKKFYWENQNKLLKNLFYRCKNLDRHLEIEGSFEVSFLVRDLLEFISTVFLLAEIIDRLCTIYICLGWNEDVRC